MTVGEIGAISIRLPLPPGALPTLWRNDDRFVESYMAAYPGYYQTGDAGVIDKEGYLHVMSRTDDIINVAGHRLSTGGMEQVLASHQDVAECAVLGVADALKGQVPLGFLVLKDRRRRGAHGAPGDRTGGLVPPSGGGQTVAKDPVRQDPARHYPEHSGLPGLSNAGDHR